MLERWDGQKPMQIMIGEVKEKRTLSQSALYWMWIDIIANYSGDSKEAVHQDMGYHFLPRMISKQTGNAYPISTTKLNTKDMVEYMEKVKALAGTMGIVLPEPADLQDFSVYER
ncbi:hypothetical protein LZG72_28605 [Dyadobacter sp. CY323]|nr:hypothetical protein [Dyadobacter sp. CY323]